MGIFPASWINANFDVWIGSAEDVAAWELLWDAREAYARGVEARAKGRENAPTEEGLKKAQESLLAAEGSDWCWWYGPEHSTANDAEFDALYRKHLTGIYLCAGTGGAGGVGETDQEEAGAGLPIATEHELEGESGWNRFELFRMAGSGSVLAVAARRERCTDGCSI